MPQVEREDYDASVKQLQEELAASEPRRGRLRTAWGAVQTFATIEGTVQGATRVQDLVYQLAPHMATLLAHLQRMAGG